MTRKQRKKDKKWLWWVVFVTLLLVLIGGAVYLVWNGKMRVSNGGVSDKRDDETASVMDEKEEGGEKDGKDSGDEDTEVTEEEKKEIAEKMEHYGDEDTPNGLDGLTGVVTYAGVIDGELVVRVNIDQYLTEGTCVLTLMQGGKSIYVETTGIKESATTATCEGFNVPVNGLVVEGAKITVGLSADGKRGEIVGEVGQ